jgi:BirA family biotin operon repressor/biotin-[acetyl-CoA-carboxylase] ligase
LFNKTIFIGKYFKELESVDSTNSFAASLIKDNGAKNGMIVFTNNQTNGKGQREKTWNSEPNENLTFSLIIKSDFLKITQQFLLSMAISNALHDFTNKKCEGFSNRAFIKWPNDILVNNQKIAGILIENTISKHNLEWSVIGIGFNLNQTNFQLDSLTDFPPISLKYVTKISYSIYSELEYLCKYLEKWLLKLMKFEFKTIQNYYEKNLWNMHKNLIYTNENAVIKKGNVVGISLTGFLLIKDEMGIIDSSTKITVQRYQ